MKKSLPDTLREEFNSIISKEEYQEIIKSKNMDINIINKSYDILLKRISEIENAGIIEKIRAELETNIINTLKDQTYDN